MLSYWQALDTFELTTLDDRQKKLCENTFNKIKQATNMLHYLLTNVRENSQNLRSFKKRENAKTHVKRTDGSFINHCLATSLK